MLHQEKWSREVHRDGLLPFVQRDFSKRLHYRDTGIVHQEIDWLLANRRNQVVYTANRR